MMSLARLAACAVISFTVVVAGFKLGNSGYFLAGFIFLFPGITLLRPLSGLMMQIRQPMRALLVGAVSAVCYTVTLYFVSDTAGPKTQKTPKIHPR